MYICTALSLCFLVLMKETANGSAPSFDAPYENVTVIEGETAVLPCSVDNRGTYHVFWMDQRGIFLSMDEKRIINDARFCIERPFTREWNLHIRSVKYSDDGEYTCMINTTPRMAKRLTLIVKVPPKIIDELSSRDQTIRDGDNVTLVCNVTGVPAPEVAWSTPFSNDDVNAEKQRLDHDLDALTSFGECNVQQIGFNGNMLRIFNVSRDCDGIFTCKAFNKVDPEASRDIKVLVEFPPEVNFPFKRIAQVVGRETVLECDVSSYPRADIVWEKDGELIDRAQTHKYTVDTYFNADDTTTLSLHIHTLEQDDFGTYTCYAKNGLGEDRESIVLYQYRESTQREIEPKYITSTPPRSSDSVNEDGEGVKPTSTGSALKIRENIGAALVFVCLLSKL